MKNIGGAGDFFSAAPSFDLEIYVVGAICLQFENFNNYFGLLYHPSSGAPDILTSLKEQLP